MQRREMATVDDSMDRELATILASSPQNAPAYRYWRAARECARVTLSSYPTKENAFRYHWCDFRLQLLRWWTCPRTIATPWQSFVNMASTAFWFEDRRQ